LTNVRLVAFDGTAIVADLIVQAPGMPPMVCEVKTGVNPIFTPNQRRVYPMTQVGGHVTSPDPRISAVGLTPGQPLPPLGVIFIYQKGPGFSFDFRSAPDPYAKFLRVLRDDLYGEQPSCRIQ
jgi:hypothetical protein